MSLAASARRVIIHLDRGWVAVRNSEGWGVAVADIDEGEGDGDHAGGSEK